MVNAAFILDQIAAGLSPFGLVTRGGFIFDEADRSPVLAGITPVSVVMVGHFGSSFWPHFVDWRRSRPEGIDPLDTWTKEVLHGIAAKFGATAVFPSDKPYLPFQQWAKRAEGLSASPLGMLIHPEYGLWQAFRGALLFEHSIEFPQLPSLAHPCDVCEHKPCLSTCPVRAFDGVGFAVDHCRDYLATQAGETCIDGGCLARLACPIGREHAYVPDQQRFHMAAFA
jgi:ferredoxin